MSELEERFNVLKDQLTQEIIRVLITECKIEQVNFAHYLRTGRFIEDD